MYIVVSQCYERRFVFSQRQLFNQTQSHFSLASSVAILRNGRSSAERSSQFRPPKSCKKEVSLLERSKPKSTQYKDGWTVDVFRHWQAVRKKNIPLLESGSVFKDYDVHQLKLQLKL